MKGFSFCSELYGDLALDEVAVRLARLGYSGIELDARALNGLEVDEFAQRCSGLGIAVVGLHWLLAGGADLHLTHPSTEVRANVLRRLQSLAVQCARLGGSVMVLGSGRNRRLLEGVTRAEASAFALDVLSRLGDTLAACDVRLGIEPLATDDFISDAASAAELVEQIACPRIGLTLDARAMQIETRPRDQIVRAYGSHLVHVHVNDTSGKGPGMGETDLGPMLAALKQVNYAGWISVEAFESAPGPDAVAHSSLAYLRQHWETR